MTLLVEDVVQRVGDLLEDPVGVAAVQKVLSGLLQLLAHLAQTLQLLTVGVASTALHEPPQRAAQVAVVQQIVGQFVEEIAGLHVEPGLGSVPPRIGESTGHDRTLVPKLRPTVVRPRG